jgi:universal stress protein E
MTQAINRPCAVGIDAQITRGVGARRPKVLCATDLSPRSGRAVQRAAMLMQRLDAQMLLLHVIDETQSARMIRHRAERARISLYWQVRKLAKMDGAPQASVLVGKPHQTIARVAKEWGADLIILGAYRRQFGDKFLGTTAERVIQAGLRPVLIVNREPTGPYADVLLATDRSDAFAGVARLTQNLGLLEGACASIVQALEPPDRMVFYAAGITEPEIGQYMRHFKQASSDDLLAQLDAAGLDSARFSVIQQHASPLYAIEHAVERTGSDLLVIGAR